MTTKFNRRAISTDHTRRTNGRRCDSRGAIIEAVFEWDWNAPERHSGPFLDDRNAVPGVPVLLRQPDSW